MNKTFVTRSAAETARLAENLGQKINGPVCVVFNGGLGAGKTHFCAGLCRGLGYFGDVTSPTFTIVNEYLGGRLPIFHFDLYRIFGEEDLYALGFYDYLDQNGVLLLEWGEHLGTTTLENPLLVKIEITGEQERRIALTGTEVLLKELTL